MLIDSHAHLDMDDFDDDRDLVINRARRGGVDRIVTIGVDLASSVKAIEIAGKYEFVYATVGLLTLTTPTRRLPRNWNN